VKLPYTATCHAWDADSVAIDTDADGDVQILAQHVGAFDGDHDERVTVYLTPEKARRLAKALKKAAKRAEAGK
jgi:hypothetical protein